MYEQVTHNHFNFQQYSASGPSALQGQKAIAVVQPLSTEQQVMASDKITSKTPQKTTQTTSASELLKVNSTTKGQHALSPAQGQGEGGEVLVPCSEETDCSVTSAEGVLELSPIPTIPWSLEKCTNLLKMCQNFSEKDSASAIEKDVASTILNHYWGGSYNRLLYMLQSDYYKKFLAFITKSCGNMKHTVLRRQHHLTRWNVLKTVVQSIHLRPWKAMSWLQRRPNDSLNVCRCKVKRQQTSRLRETSECED